MIKSEQGERDRPAMESIPALRPGQILKGPLFNKLMRVETVEAIDEGY
jgi:hypothetical protein